MWSLQVSLIIDRTVLSLVILITGTLTFVYCVHLYKVWKRAAKNYDKLLIVFQLLASFSVVVMSITGIINGSLSRYYEQVCSIFGPFSTAIYGFQKYCVYVYLIRRLEIIKSHNVLIEHDKLLKSLKALSYVMLVVISGIYGTSTGHIEDEVCISGYIMGIAALGLLIDVCVSVGCLYIFQKLVMKNALSPEIRNIGRRNLYAGAIAVGSSFFTMIVLIVFNLLVHNDRIEMLMNLLAFVDVCISCLSLFYVNMRGILSFYSLETSQVDSESPSMRFQILPLDSTAVEGRKQPRSASKNIVGVY